MCSRTEKLYPGPLEGPLIVDMTASAKDGMRKQRTQKQTPMNWTYSIQLDRIDMRDSVQGVITKAFYENFLTHFMAEGERKDIQNQLTWL